MSLAQGFGRHFQEERGALRSPRSYYVIPASRYAHSTYGVTSFRHHGDRGPRRLGIAAFQAGRYVVHSGFQPGDVKRLFRGVVFL